MGDIGDEVMDIRDAIKYDPDAIAMNITLTNLLTVYKACNELEGCHPTSKRFPVLIEEIRSKARPVSAGTRQEPQEIFEGTRAALSGLTVKPHEHEWIRGAIQYHCKCGAILSEAGSRERDAADRGQDS